MPPAVVLPTVPSALPAAVAAVPSAAPAAPPAPDLSPHRPYIHAYGGPELPPDERARRAVESRRATVEGLFAAAKVPFPPAEMLFRAFKQEHELEVWASAAKGAPMSLVATYTICNLSGELGPKRREGDAQVPEGFYKIQYLWPNSRYHLELKVSYPSELDRRLAEKASEPPGGNIMIHGSCASLGCLAMTNERIEELWTMASAFHGGDRRVHVHIFPARDIPALLRDPARAEHHRFWANLQEGVERFERSHRLFEVDADWRARYVFR